MEWISVKDVKPKQGVEVIVWHSKRKTQIMATAYNSKYKGKVDHWNYYDVNGSNRIEFDSNEITLWMPKPLNPRTPKEEKK